MQFFWACNFQFTDQTWRKFDKLEKESVFVFIVWSKFDKERSKAFVGNVKI